MKTNTQLQVDVMEELQYEPIVDAAGIGISAKDGIVTLTGTVNSLAEKWAVSHAADRRGQGCGQSNKSRGFRGAPAK